MFKAQFKINFRGETILKKSSSINVSEREGKQSDKCQKRKHFEIFCLNNWSKREIRIV